MKIYVKLCLVFIITAIVTTAIGIFVNLAIRNQYNAEYLQNMHVQIISDAELLQKQLRNIDDNLIRMSQSSEANLFANYQVDYDFRKIYEKSGSLFQQLHMMQNAYPYVQNIYLMFDMLDRQITSSTRYDALNQQIYQRFYEDESGIRIDGDSIFLGFKLSTNPLVHSRSLVGMEMSKSALLQHCLGNSSGRFDLGLIIADDSTDLEKQLVWNRVDNGYTMDIPIYLMNHDTTLILSAFLSDESKQTINANFAIWTISLILLMIAGIMVFTMLMHRIVNKPLNVLIEAFSRVAAGDMKIRIDTTANDEFGQIYQNFNSSVQTLESTIVNEYQSRMTAQQAQIRYLQAQIQPHFLYNAFYQMYRMCRSEGIEYLSEYALSLSQYYEYITHNISDSHHMSTIREELDQTRRYIEIQQIRFPNQLNVEFDIVDNELNMPVPQMVLQPIVENSIKHCLETQGTDNLLIRIRLFRDIENIYLIAEDNGSRLSDEEIERQKERLRNADYKVNMSGLTNIHLRICLMGHSEGLHLSRSDLGGLRVCMVFSTRKIC